ncbi:MAG TPA: type II secretion system F family protein [Persephonella sp.]|uniref:Fimbrial assembly protein PilC2 n=1 Tax=Persephonella marina (strain DSM 14350 / EX-H1) TaxID=123214 RepID=C0QPL6_PERMH|nr:MULTISPECIES: type II secretion system F family protein [Persephonella]ACO04667.1 fimbrial assembly protein PilC2 [Persephonella marina EX-H1]HCB69773.1 type II secretion system F family protein [Persephonella sp.]
MPFYRYRAFSKDGKEVTAVEEAVSVSHLKSILSSKDLVPYEIEEVTAEQKRRSVFQLEIFRRKKISNEDLSLLLYEIGILLERNVHITQIFDILSKQMENQEIKKAVLSAKTYLQEGSSVSEALGKTKIFPRFLVEMIRAGETSGALDKIFLSASEFIEKQEEFKRKIINSLIYPSIVIGVGFLAMIVIMNFVVPTITNIYQQFGKELPTSTKIVVAFSNISSTFLKFLPVLVIPLFFMRKRFLNRKVLDRIRLKIPFFNKVHRYSIYSTWSNTLGILLKGGLTLDRAVEISNETINNIYIREGFNTVAEEIKKGKSLSDLLKREKLLPENSIQLLKIGEETGQLDKMLLLVSQIYKKQTERLISLFLSYLEPAVLIILSVLIGFFVFATLLPIFNLSIK